MILRFIYLSIHLSRYKVFIHKVDGLSDDTKIETYIYLFVLLSIYPSIYLFIYRSIHLSIYSSIYLSINLFRFEVFIHKVDGLSDDTKMETQRDIHQRANDDIIEAGLEQQVYWYPILGVPNVN